MKHQVKALGVCQRSKSKTNFRRNEQMKDTSLLWQLQVLEKELKEIDRGKDLQKQRKQLEDYKAEFQRKKRSLMEKVSQYKQQENTINKDDLKIKNLNYEINTIQEKLYEGNIHNIKTYESINEELKEYTIKKDEVETEILNLMEGKEHSEQEIKKLKKEVLNIQKKYQSEKNKHKVTKESKEVKEKKLIQERETLLRKIDPSLLKEYRRIQKNIDPPMAMLENETCKGCHMGQSKMLLKEIKKVGQIHTCESCGRILYIRS